MCRIICLQIRCLCILQLSVKPTINLFLVIQDKLNYVIYCSNDIISRIRRRILIGTGLIIILVGVCMFLGTRNQDFCTRYLYRTVLGSILQSTLRNALRVKLAIIQQLYSWIGQGNAQLQILVRDTIIARELAPLFLLHVVRHVSILETIISDRGP